MKVLVTGATGFIGGNLVRALKARGYDVRALVRDQSSTLTLENTGVEVVPGDVRDRESVARALEGCQAVFHCAALYTFWSLEPREVYQVNVEGTKTVFEEALKSGVEGVVYTSTVSTIGIPKKGVGTEEMEPSPRDLIGHYKRSKYQGEKEALRAASKGLPVVVVNPTAPVGPWDVKPTPTGGIVLDFLRGRIPAYVNTGMNMVDVEDVATGHILALEKGQPGQRYILGNRNMTLKELLRTLESITGKKGPRLRVPINLVVALGIIDQLIEGKLLRRRPRIPLEGMRVARKPMYVSSAKAVRELGLPQSPVEGALEKAVRWFRDNGRV
ncbi:MAG: NAD-dependent epimerase/dehydratase family protein [Chloroflexi bacterium]|nr:NAD-dependent epimerase/dehydratase family protein [Chloroflexota bacterium]